MRRERAAWLLARAAPARRARRRRRRRRPISRAALPAAERDVFDRAAERPRAPRAAARGARGLPPRPRRPARLRRRGARGAVPDRQPVRLDEALEVTERFEARGARRAPRGGRAASTARRVHRETYALARAAAPPRAGPWDLVFESARAGASCASASRSARPGDGRRSSARSRRSSACARSAARQRACRCRRSRRGASRVELAGEEGFYLEPSLRFETRDASLEARERVGVPLEESPRARSDGRHRGGAGAAAGLVPRVAADRDHDGALRPRRRGVRRAARPGPEPRSATRRVFRRRGAGAVEERDVYLQPGARRSPACRDRGRRQPAARGAELRRRDPAARR